MDKIHDKPQALAQFDNPTLLHQYHQDAQALQIIENQDYRWIQSAEGTIHSAMCKSRSHLPVLPYFPMLLSALIFNTEPHRCLLLGLGGGELVRFFNHYYPTNKLLAVDNSETMQHAFEHYFQPQGAEYESLTADICDPALALPDTQFDLIIQDVYSDTGMPACCYEVDYYKNLANKLNTHGLLATNLVVNNEQGAVQLLQPIREAFAQRTLCLSVGQHMNLVVLAFNNNPPDDVFSLEQLQQRARQLSTRLDIDFLALLSNLSQHNPHPEEHLAFY